MIKAVIIDDEQHCINRLEKMLGDYCADSVQVCASFQSVKDSLAGIQILNSIGALFIVYAFRYGRAIIVSPLTNAGAPVITIILSLLIYGVFPHSVVLSGMILAVIAIFLLAD